MKWITQRSYSGILFVVFWTPYIYPVARQNHIAHLEIDMENHRSPSLSTKDYPHSRRNTQPWVLVVLTLRPSGGYYDTIIIPVPFLLLIVQPTLRPLLRTPQYILHGFTKSRLHNLANNLAKCSSSHKHNLHPPSIGIHPLALAHWKILSCCDPLIEGM